jgi:hypothetical protein
MKRVHFIIVLIVLCLSLVACDIKINVDPTSNDEIEETDTNIENPINDEGSEIVDNDETDGEEVETDPSSEDSEDTREEITLPFI